MTNENPYDEEWFDINSNVSVTLIELRNRIENLRLDTIQINDPEVKGFAEKLYTNLRIEYYKILRDDLTLQKLYSNEYDEEEENG